MKHAQKVLNIISHVFGDVSMPSENNELNVNYSDSDELNHALLGDWTAFMVDEDLLNMMVDNLSLSNSNSLLEVSKNQSFESATV